jgi:broad specificity phosphatase PhoE
MGRLLLIRHARSTWNAEGRWQGWADAPLHPSGEAQARALGTMLARTGERFVGAVSSDLERSAATARIVAGVLGLGGVEVEPDLRERDVGDWSGRTTEEIELIWPGAIDAWREGRLDRPPGGEHEPSFRTRVVSAVERLAARSEEPLLVITHGGVIRAVERHLGGDPRSTANLSGRWVEALDGVLTAGEVVSLPLDEEESITTAL